MLEQGPQSQVSVLPNERVNFKGPEDFILTNTAAASDAVR